MRIKYYPDADALDIRISDEKPDKRTTFLEENFTFLAQVLSLERKCVYGYDPLLSKEEIEGFDVNALNNLDVKIKMDGVIVAVAHDEFKNKSFLSTCSFFRKKVCLWV